MALKLTESKLVLDQENGNKLDEDKDGLQTQRLTYLG